MSVSVPPLQLSDYLENLPGTTLKKLYLAPSSAFAIFRRMLPPLAQTLIVKSLYAPCPLLLREIDLLIRPNAMGQRDQALAILRSLHIINISAAAKDKPQDLTITHNFKTSFRLHLEGGGAHNSYGVPSPDPAPEQITPSFLDDYSRRKWDSVLQYVVNSTAKALLGARAAVGDVVKSLLMQGQLVRPGNGGTLKITQAGFTFLLQEANAQIWTMLILWLTSAQHSGRADMDSVDMLGFLFMLGTMELGRPYDTNALPESRRNMLPDLVDFGLIYIDTRGTGQYFPTRMATSLTTSGSGPVRSMSEAFTALTEDDGADRMGIMVETNYRLYCYTKSPLQIAVLSLFSKLYMRMPDLVSARLTKRSVQNAVDFGITADQIIRYLETHAHEQMHKNALGVHKPLLPPTVVDQIRLWQLDRERMQHQTGFMFRDFTSMDEYTETARYAEEIGVLLWRSDDKAMFFVSRHEQLANYLKLKKKGA